MTKTTESRQLRLMVDGILSAYGIDDLKLSIDLCESFKKFYSSPDKPKTREEILGSVKRAMEKGFMRQDKLEKIRTEIETRVHISPIGREWEDFIAWAYKKEESGESINKFLDWWVSDEWRLAHPPYKPQNWYVQWPQAFLSTPSQVEKKTDSSGTPMSY